MPGQWLTLVLPGRIQIQGMPIWIQGLLPEGMPIRAQSLRRPPCRCSGLGRCLAFPRGRHACVPPPAGQADVQQRRGVQARERAACAAAG